MLLAFSIALQSVVIGLYYGLLAPHAHLDPAPAALAALSPADMFQLWLRHHVDVLSAPVSANYALLLGSPGRAVAQHVRGDSNATSLEQYRLVSFQLQDELLEELLTSVDRTQVTDCTAPHLLPTITFIIILT